MNRKILILRSNPCDPDPRVEKEARALSKIAEVEIFAWDRESRSEREENLAFAKISRFKFRAPYGKIGLIFALPFWGLRVAFKALFARYDILHACDFDTYFPAILAAKLRRKKVVYDIFDFYAEMINLPSFICRPIAWLDKKLLRLADLVILADKSRRVQIRGSRPKKLVYIYNTPEVKIAPPVKPRKNYFFYAGLLSKDRYIKELLELFAKNPNWHLEIAGWGPEDDLVKKYAKKFKNIEYLGKIPYAEVIKKTVQTSVCFAFYDPIMPNNRLASPNKLFEAMALAKPIITNPDTTMADFVLKNKIGSVVDPKNQNQLEKIFKKYLGDPSLCLKTGLHAQKLFQKEYSWEIMRERLLGAYSTLPNPSRS